MRGKGARALEGHVDTLPAGRGQRKSLRSGRRDKDARVPLEGCPTLLLCGFTVNGMTAGGC
eukprot:1800448-Pyramimonas_sp.AAC.1